LSNDEAVELVLQILRLPSRLGGIQQCESRHFTSPYAASGGSTEEGAAWHLNFLKIKIAVYGFLAPYTKCCPRHRGEPLRVDVFIALLAYPEAAFPDTTEGCTGVSKFVEFPVEVTNRECALWSRLNLIQLIGASLNCNRVAVAVKALQFSNPCR
jgi:hypothetical protein